MLNLSISLAVIQFNFGIICLNLLTDGRWPIIYTVANRQGI